MSSVSTANTAATIARRDGNPPTRGKYDGAVSGSGVITPQA